MLYIYPLNGQLTLLLELSTRVKLGQDRCPVGDPALGYVCLYLLQLTSMLLLK